MNSLNTLIEEVQNLQQQLALTASALIGHLDVYGSKNDSVYAVALCGQATENIKAAGRIIDLLTRLNKPEGVATAFTGCRCVTARPNKPEGVATTA